jgi:hypothetical protein
MTRPPRSPSRVPRGPHSLALAALLAVVLVAVGCSAIPQAFPSSGGAPPEGRPSGAPATAASSPVSSGAGGGSAGGSSGGLVSAPAGGSASAPAGGGSAAGANPAAGGPGLLSQPATPSALQPGAGTAWARGPLPAPLLIADRGNDRLVMVAPDHRVLWSYRFDLRPVSPDLGADDAFFAPDGRTIVATFEGRDVILRLDPTTGRVLWRYGHPGRPGSAPGFLHTPDDAYGLPDGSVSVADIANQRILVIAPDGRILRQLGRPGVRRHAPPAAFAAPNGDTPLPDGGLLVTEIGGSWVDRLDAAGHLVWSLHLRGIAYPSDAQLLPDGAILVVDYRRPGAVEEVAPNGQVLWRYAPSRGVGMLDHPSIALPLPNGLVAVCDDFHHRVVVIDPATNRIVWSYGQLGRPGSGPGQLFLPDGLDLVPTSLDPAALVPR